jgi:hypothetical protein
MAKFGKLVASLAARGARDPEALAAWIGKKKYGAAGMKAKAKAGEAKHHAAHAIAHHAEQITDKHTNPRMLPTSTLHAVKKHLAGKKGLDYNLAHAAVTRELRSRGEKV